MVAQGAQRLHQFGADLGQGDAGNLVRRYFETCHGQVVADADVVQLGNLKHALFGRLYARQALCGQRGAVGKPAGQTGVGGEIPGGQAPFPRQDADLDLAQPRFA